MKWGLAMSYKGHRLPRISELTAFAAAAQHSSFTRAAVELSLTQGAVSRAVAELEGTWAEPFLSGSVPVTPGV